MTEPPWSMTWTTWLSAGVVVVAVAATAWTAVNRRRPCAELPLQHAAAAALIGYVAWVSFTQLSGLIATYLTATAGFDDLGSVLLAQRVFLIVGVAFVMGIAIAIVGILRRQTWGAVLGIGLAASHVLGSVATVANLAILESGTELFGGGGYFAFIAPTLLMGAVPSIVAIGLIAWPMISRSPGATPERSESAATEWHSRTTPVDPVN
jgi:hypothetical protein